jgi:hypothetical protein
MVYLQQDPSGFFRVRPAYHVSVVSNNNARRLRGKGRKRKAELRTVPGDGGEDGGEDVGEDPESSTEAAVRDDGQPGSETERRRRRKRQKLAIPSSSPPVEIPRTQPPSSTPASSLADMRAMARSRLEDDSRAKALKDGELDDLLDTVFAVAGGEAMKHIRRLLDQLRRGGLTCLLTLPSADDLESTRLALVERAHHSLPTPEVASFYLAYQGVSRLKSKNLLDVISRRKALAELSCCYDRLKSHLDPHLKRHKQRVGEQKLGLFRLIYPAYATVDRPADDTGQCRLDWHEFTDDLRYGGRWERIRHEFGGDGIFALMPPSVVSDRFVERLPNDRFDTWLSLAREFNDPDRDLVRRASVLVDYALSGNSLPDTRLTLEIIAEEEIGRYDNASVLLDGWSSALPDGTNIIASTPDNAFGEFEEFFSSQLAEEDLTFDRDGM